MLSNTLLRAILGFVAAALALTGCGSDASSEMGSPSFPTGSYDVLATPTQVITFREDGTYTVNYPDRVLSQGTYTIDGDTYIAESDTHCASEGVTEPARYTWSWDGQMLTMALQGEDACGGRAEGQTGGMTPVSATPEPS
jgi:hypothetical protein